MNCKSITQALVIGIISETGAGSLFLDGTNIFLRKSTASGTALADFLADGAVSLYYAGAKKLETASGGVSVTGGLSATTVNGVGILSNATNFSESLLISQDAGTGTLSSAGSNTGLGFEVFDDLTSGDNNTGIGRKALTVLTTGGSNTAVGQNALTANTTASNNTAVGKSSLEANTTGHSNVAVGKDALAANTSANFNVAVGV